MENPAKNFWSYSKTPQQVKEIIMTNDVNSPETLDFEICEESDLTYARQPKKKIKKHFDGGTYLTNSPSFRDGWTKVDWDFYASLVTIKVQRKNRKNEVPVLDDIVEFRMIPTKEANELCQRLFEMDYLFVVYEGDEVRRKKNDSQ